MYARVNKHCADAQHPGRVGERGSQEREQRGDDPTNRYGFPETTIGRQACKGGYKCTGTPDKTKGRESVYGQMIMTREFHWNRRPEQAKAPKRKACINARRRSSTVVTNREPNDLSSSP